MIHHIGEPQKSFIVLNSNYYNRDTFEVDCRALANSISIGDVFEFHYQYHQSNEAKVIYELISITMNNHEVRETTINQLYTCKFKDHDQDSDQRLFHHSDVISSVKITGKQNFAGNVLEIEPADKYLSKRDIDRIPKKHNEKLFVSRSIGETICLGQKFDVAWNQSKIDKLLHVRIELKAIYSKSFAEIKELVSGPPTLVKLKSDDSDFEGLNESMTYLGLLI